MHHIEYAILLDKNLNKLLKKVNEMSNEQCKNEC